MNLLEVILLVILFFPCRRKGEKREGEDEGRCDTEIQLENIGAPSSSNTALLEVITLYMHLTAQYTYM